MSSENPPPENDQIDNNVMDMLFGPQTCATYGANIGMYILFAAISALIFFLLAFAPINRYTYGYLKHPNAHLGVKAVLFFFLMWLLIWLFALWFQSHPVCDEK